MMLSILSGNALKIIAIITMTIDHIGVILLNNLEIMRIIGRIAFPVYAFLISEGCRYTKNKLHYFLRIFAFGFVCQAVFFAVSGSLYLNILLTFSVSILMIYLLQKAQKNARLIPVFLLCTVLLYYACRLLYRFSVEFDYGFFGIMLPVIISLSDKKQGKILLAAAGITAVAAEMQGIQYWSLLSLVPLCFYNGRRGALNLKYAFYLFYPIHLALLYGLSYII